MNKLIFAFALLFLISLSSVNAIYYHERTESRTADGAYSLKEIEFRGTVSGYAEDDNYTERDHCTRSERRRADYNRYHGRGYSGRCSGRYYSRPVRSSSYDSIDRNYSYDYMGRQVTRTSTY